MEYYTRRPSMLKNKKSILLSLLCIFSFNCMEAGEIHRIVIKDNPENPIGSITLRDKDVLRIVSDSEKQYDLDMYMVSKSRTPWLKEKDSVLVSSSSSDHFSFEVSASRQDMWERAYHFHEGEDNLFKGFVTIHETGSDDKADTLHVSFNVAPKIPKLLSYRFDYEGYDYDIGMFINPSAKYDFANITEPYLWVFISFEEDACYPDCATASYTIKIDNVEDDVIHIDDDLEWDWGYHFLFGVRNAYGLTLAEDTICPKEQITDPKLLEWYKEQVEKYSGINTIEKNDESVSFSIADSWLTINGLKEDRLTVTITDCLGVQRKRIRNRSRINISDLKSGIYIIQMKTEKYQTVTKKIFLK